MNIKATTKRNALILSGYDKIYYKGNTPYSIERNIYTYKIFAIKISKGNFYISKERIN